MKKENLRLLAVLITFLNYWLCKDGKKKHKTQLNAKVNHIITYLFFFFLFFWFKSIHY